MHRKVASLSVFAAVAVTGSSVSVSPVRGAERFTNAASNSEHISSMAPAQRVAPVRAVDTIQNSDGAAILMPLAAVDNPRPTVSNTVDTNASMGKITTSAVSKLLLNSAAKTTAD